MATQLFMTTFKKGYFIADKTGRTEDVSSDLTGFGNEERAFHFWYITRITVTFSIMKAVKICSTQSS